MRITFGSYTFVKARTPVFSPSRIGRAAKNTCQTGRQAITEKRPMQARICQVVLLGSSTDRRNVTNVLHHCCQSNRGNGNAGTDAELGKGGRMQGHAPTRGFIDRGEIHFAHGQCHNIRANDTNQNRKDLDHPTAPDMCRQ